MSTATLPKVYICGADHPWGDVLMFAVAEDGEVLAEHMCSNRSFGRFDLHDRKDRAKAYEAKFGGYGDGEHYELVFVEKWTDVPQGVRDRNAANAAGEQDDEQERATDV